MSVENLLFKKNDIKSVCCTEFKKNLSLQSGKTYNFFDQFHYNLHTFWGLIRVKLWTNYNMDSE